MSDFFLGIIVIVFFPFYLLFDKIGEWIAVRKMNAYFRATKHFYRPWLKTPGNHL